MDIIAITDLTVETIIGVFDWERKVKQKLIFNIEFGIDAHRIAENDSIADAVDYGKLSEKLIEFCESHQFKLIETLLSRATKYLKQEFNLPWIKMKITKPGCVPKAKSVSICLEG